MINDIKYRAQKDNITPSRTMDINKYSDVKQVLNEALERLPKLQKGGYSS